MQCYNLDASLFTTAESMHEHLQSQFAFPAYYGKNLDAFWDCIRERKGGCIRIENIQQADPEVFLSFYTVLLDLCKADANWKIETYTDAKKKCFLSRLFK